ncbi:MAG: hypothetical protein HY664_02475 [Chloroflexi bacterium]|nr:hypothetical protein [Chloroflexota bacterium]
MSAKMGILNRKNHNNDNSHGTWWQLPSSREGVVEEVEDEDGQHLEEVSGESGKKEVEQQTEDKEMQILDETSVESQEVDNQAESAESHEGQHLDETLVDSEIYELDQQAEGNEGQRLGKILIEAGLIYPEELEIALDISRQEKKRLGEVLVERKLVTPFNIARALHVQKTRVSRSDNIISEMPASPIPKHDLMPGVAPEGTSADGKWGYTLAFKVAGENAPKAEVIAFLSVNPALTLLEINNTVSPEPVTDGATSSVVYAMTVRNVGETTAFNVILTGDGFPDWFEISEVEVDGEPIPYNLKDGKGLPLGDISVGANKIVTVSGTVFPHLGGYGSRLDSQEAASAS